MSSARVRLYEAPTFRGVVADGARSTSGPNFELITLPRHAPVLLF